LLIAKKKKRGFSLRKKKNKKEKGFKKAKMTIILAFELLIGSKSELHSLVFPLYYNLIL
jgi:hypothetical protein